MLELAVDDGLEPAELIGMLVTQGFATLWQLFGGFVSNSNAPQNLQRERLTEFLLRHTDKAAGGFIGPRDRSVAQIKDEANLFRAAQHELYNNVAPRFHERASMALKMQEWLTQNVRFGWACTPAPRSFWRSTCANVVTKGLAIAAILAFGGLFWAPFAFGPVALIPALIVLVALAFAAVLIGAVIVAACVLLLSAIIPALLALIAILVVPPYLGARWVLAMFVALVAATIWIGVWLFCRDAGQFAHNLSCSLATLMSAAVILWLIPAFLRVLSKWVLGDPVPYDLKRGQQVPNAVDKCEAELAGRVNHMISLTEVRRPYWLFAPILRFWLWAIGIVGHIWCTDGLLGTAPGILFGHWHVIDRHRRLLFCSNFDSPFGGYLDDFINGARSGVNMVWRWTRLLVRDAALPGDPAVTHRRKYPPTSFWIRGGCANEQWFKAYARDSMLPHIYRYEAYERIETSIDRATNLRDALSGPRTPVNDDQILRALES
jgi:hypothetical protein